MTHEEIIKVIGNNIRKARKEKGLYQFELADLVGVNRNSIIHIESGKRHANLWTLMGRFVERSWGAMPYLSSSRRSSALRASRSRSIWACSRWFSSSMRFASSAMSCGSGENQPPRPGAPAAPSWFIVFGTYAPWYSSGIG